MELVIGTLKRQSSERLSWREWLKVKHESEQDIFENSYDITFIFSPNKFPNATIVFFDPELEKEVKKTVDPKIYTELAKRLPKLTDTIAKLHITKKGEVKIQLEKKSGYCYTVERYGLKLTTTEDIPF